MGPVRPHLCINFVQRDNEIRSQPSTPDQEQPASLGLVRNWSKPFGTNNGFAKDTTDCRMCIRTDSSAELPSDRDLRFGRSFPQLALSTNGYSISKRDPGRMKVKLQGVEVRRLEDSRDHLVVLETSFQRAQ